MGDLTILIQSEDIFLRDTRLDDIETSLKWKTNGQWRYFDSPWEGVDEKLTEEQEKEYRQRFKKFVEAPKEIPRKGAYVCVKDGTPIGFVTRYTKDRFADVLYLGIDICEDDYLEKGLGTQAMKAWVDYLFINSNIHKLEIHTWSMNPRMIRVAEKLGFKHEGTERELLRWQGEWQNRERYGLLREEWKKSGR